MRLVFGRGVEHALKVGVERGVLPGLFEVADGFGAFARYGGVGGEGAFPDLGPEDCVGEVGWGAGGVLDCGGREVLAGCSLVRDRDGV